MSGGHLKTVLASEQAAFDNAGYLAMQKKYSYAVSREWDTKKRNLTTGRSGVAEANASRALNKHAQPFQMIGLLNPFINFLGINQQLPAIFFVLSRKKCDQYANRVTTCLVDHIERDKIERVFDFYVRKLPNADQYSQVVNLKQHLIKGVGVHHSGMFPLLKEIVEVLFTQGLIKVMFATETLAIGVNTPTKLVCFVDVTKHNGKETRPLIVEEFKQMAGRAGRRGLDTVGHVVYFPLHEPVTGGELSSMMTGAIKKITSKFNVSTHYVLRSIASFGTNGCSVNDIFEQTRTSLIQTEYDALKQGCITQLEDAVILRVKLNGRILALDNDGQLMELHNDITAAALINGNKKARAIAIKQADIRVEALSKGRRGDYDKLRTIISDLKHLDSRVETLIRERDDLPTLLYEEIQKTVSFLETRGYVYCQSGDTHWSLTVRGVFANEIGQCHQLILAEPFLAHNTPHMDAPTLASWLAVFIDDNTSASDTLTIPPITDLGTDVISNGEKLFDEMEKAGIYTGDFNLSCRYVDPVWEWCTGAHLQTICQDYQLFEGNAIRSLLRLISLMEELRAACEAIQWIEWTNVIDVAKELVVRDVLKTESLYLA
jgi:superfamily II RNA helicase